MKTLGKTIVNFVLNASEEDFDKIKSGDANVGTYLSIGVKTVVIFAVFYLITKF